MLERDGGNLKALYRRAQAYLATADYLEAEQDIRKGLFEVGGGGGLGAGGGGGYGGVWCVCVCVGGWGGGVGGATGRAFCICRTGWAAMAGRH